MNLGRKTFTYLHAGILVFIIGGLIFVWGAYNIMSLPTKMAEMDSAKQQLASLKAKNTKLTEYVSSSKNIDTNLDVVQTAIPAADNVPMLMTQVENISKSSGMTVETLTFSSPGANSPAPATTTSTGDESPTSAKKVMLTVSVSGSYASLDAFLRSIEQTSRIITVTNLRYGPGKDESEAATVTATLGITSYYLAEKTLPSGTSISLLDTSASSFTDLMKKVKNLRVYKPESSL